MSALSPILRLASGSHLIFWCPGCDMPHMIGFGEGDGPRWSWNGNAERPTFQPSVLVRRNYGEDQHSEVCHSFVTDGQIQFLGDCTHALAGQTVPLPAWPSRFHDGGHP